MPYSAVKVSLMHKHPSTKIKVLITGTSPALTKVAASLFFLAISLYTSPAIAPAAVVLTMQVSVVRTGLPVQMTA